MEVLNLSLMESILFILNTDRSGISEIHHKSVGSKLCSLTTTTKLTDDVDAFHFFFCRSASYAIIAAPVVIINKECVFPEGKLGD